MSNTSLLVLCYVSQLTCSLSEGSLDRRSNTSLLAIATGDLNLLVLHLREFWIKSLNTSLLGIALDDLNLLVLYPRELGIKCLNTSLLGIALGDLNLLVLYPRELVIKSLTPHC